MSRMNHDGGRSFCATATSAGLDGAHLIRRETVLTYAPCLMLCSRGGVATSEGTLRLNEEQRFWLGDLAVPFDRGSWAHTHETSEGRTRLFIRQAVWVCAPGYRLNIAVIGLSSCVMARHVPSQAGNVTVHMTFSLRFCLIPTYQYFHFALINTLITLN